LHELTAYIEVYLQLHCDKMNVERASMVIFQVLKAAGIMVIFFGDDEPCILVDVYRRSHMLAASIIRALMEAASTLKGL
jgi:hypothetical protein